VRLRALLRAQPSGTFLQHHQALSRHRNPLRKDRQKLPRRRPPRRLLYSCGNLQVKLQNPKRLRHQAGANLLQPAKERRPVRGGLEACTRTSPTRTSKTGHTPTTEPTATVWCAPKRGTIRTDSSASTNRSRVAFQETLHRLEGPQMVVGTGV
jgi:hypothetical protein